MIAANTPNITDQHPKTDWELDFYSRPILEYDGKKRWKTHKPAKTTTNANDTSTTYNMATKFLQGVSSINQLNSFKESVITRHKEGKLTDMDKAKLENAIVQKEASLL